MRSSCEVFSQLVIRGKGPLWVVPSLGCSCFLTCLSSSPDFLGDKQQYGSIS
ncbi:hypothetical protein T4B_9808 [Trichinella pseudospiralis]|uniref:Uncharacterized protein n=1 Tax=Trichinella pseudospiralis TaxID=6337 RepID=A0A0V1GA96_TRIPS|nr:hypothetical protein T4B_9808 [Trichinella pseudospiralis]